MNRWASEVLQAYYEKEDIHPIMEKVTQETHEIIKRLPYIGGNKNAYTSIIEMNGWFIGFFKVMKSYEFIPEAVAYINREVFIRYCEQVPKMLWRPIGTLAFSTLAKRYFKNQAKNSQQRIYPEDFEYTFEVNQKKNGYTFNFSSCALQKHYEAEGVNELKKFCNFGDPVYSAMFGMGCNASHSFATGYDNCILSFEKGRQTEQPDNITRMIEVGEAFLQRHTLSN